MTDYVEIPASTLMGDRMKPVPVRLAARVHDLERNALARSLVLSLLRAQARKIMAKSTRSHDYIAANAVFKEAARILANNYGMAPFAYELEAEEAFELENATVFRTAY